MAEINHPKSTNMPPGLQGFTYQDSPELSVVLPRVTWKDLAAGHAKDKEQSVTLEYHRWNPRSDVLRVHKVLDKALTEYPVWITNAIKELVNNASDSIVHAHKGQYGDVSLTLHTGEKFKAIIDDTGSGIDPRLEPYLFQEYMTERNIVALGLPPELAKLNWAQSELSLLRGGKGQALRTIATYVKSCGGSYGISNKGVGIGAVVWFEVPSPRLTNIMAGDFMGN